MSHILVLYKKNEMKNEMNDVLYCIVLYYEALY